MRVFNCSSSSVHKLFIVLLLSCLIVSCSITPKHPDEAKLQKTEKPTVKSEAEKRVAAWKELIATNQNIPEDRKLALVNEFINRLIFVSDIDHWGQKDYWATPLETISSGGGDCEDLAIAKYFTLKYMNVPAERIRLTYVKALHINKAHMVLIYFPPGSKPLVLDNFDEGIKPSSQRTDLLSFYSFNSEGLWLAKKLDSGKYVGNSDRISLWQKLLGKMQKNKENS